MAAVACPVGLQRLDDIVGRLSGDHGHRVDFGERGPVHRDAMAADAHRVLSLRRLGASLRVSGQTCEESEERDRQRYSHFAFSAKKPDHSIPWRRPPYRMVRLFRREREMRISLAVPLPGVLACLTAHAHGSTESAKGMNS